MNLNDFSINNPHDSVVESWRSSIWRTSEFYESRSGKFFFYLTFLISDLLICFSIFNTSILGIQTDLPIHVVVDSKLPLTQRAFLISIFNTNVFIVVYIFL